MIAENHDLRKEVLQACRGLGSYGLGSGIGGHVSARYPGEPYFYINIFDRTFEEMQIEDIILVDFKGNAVNSSRSPSVGIDFHHAIYNQRPDVQSVVHSHGFWITAQAAFCRPPRIFNNVSAVFYERTVISPNDDFRSIGEAIGHSDIAIVIPWHGAITVGSNVGEAGPGDHKTHARFTCDSSVTIGHEPCALLMSGGNMLNVRGRETSV